MNQPAVLQDESPDGTRPDPPTQELPPTGTELAPASPLSGFWMGGFEGADHVNGDGVALDMALTSGHIDRLDEDHRRAAQSGLTAVRESIGWRLAEGPGGHIDLTRAVAIALSARRHRLQVLWTLMHYGVPGDLCLHDDSLIDRFARFAEEVARVLAPLSAHPPVFTLVNEISFVAWAAAMPGILHPPDNTAPGEDAHCRARGYAVKRRLVRASLAGIERVRRVTPHARFLHVDPVVHVVAPRDRPDLAPQAAEMSGWQWQAWDMLSGRADPALGGSPAALDLVGLNHYHSSQWEIGSEQRLHWHLRDSRRRPLHDLMSQVWQRYRRPLMVAETSHVGIGRASWLSEVAAEVSQARDNGVPVLGVCLYPLVDRPDWADPSRWHRSGLFHVSRGRTPLGPVDSVLPEEGAGCPPDRAGGQPMLSRCADPVYLACLRGWQRVLPHRQTPEPPLLLVFSHLRWDGVAHRSRHLMSRLAGRWRIAFVEEPRTTPGLPGVDCHADGPWIDVVTPHVPFEVAGFSVNERPLLQSLLQEWLGSRRQTPLVVLITTPMAWPLAHRLQPQLLVYDCADELAGFLGAPAVLPLLECNALASADLVLAAGPSLAAARRCDAGQRLHLLPNGVDVAHFKPRRQGHDAGWDAEEALTCLPATAGPCLGYAGVIDERFDEALLQRLATAHPNWHFVMVGPVMKIDAASLPQGANIHWLGFVPYRLLPQLMSRWQVALLPFRLNLATLRANPLKVHEYIAAGLPVVATALPDVERLGRCDVRVAADHAAFDHACQHLLADATPTVHTRRRRRGRHSARSWQVVANALHRILLAALTTRAPLEPARQEQAADVR